LRLKSCAGLPVVKCAEKGILLGIGDALGIEPLGKDRRKRALADAYGTFYRNIPGEIEKLGHEDEESVLRISREQVPRN